MSTKSPSKKGSPRSLGFHAFQYLNLDSRKADQGVFGVQIPYVPDRAAPLLGFVETPPMIVRDVLNIHPRTSTFSTFNLSEVEGKLLVIQTQRGAGRNRPSPQELSAKKERARKLFRALGKADLSPESQFDLYAHKMK